MNVEQLGPTARFAWSILGPQIVELERRLAEFEQRPRTMRLAFVGGEVGALIIAFLSEERVKMVRVALSNYATLCGAEGDEDLVQRVRRLMQELG